MFVGHVTFDFCPQFLGGVERELLLGVGVFSGVFNPVTPLSMTIFISAGTGQQFLSNF